VLGARRVDRLVSLADQLNRGGGKALSIVTDVTDRHQVKTLVDTAVKEFGRVDVMIKDWLFHVGIHNAWEGVAYHLFTKKS
jgi:NADP-dependent 3-hydroxy acid dehydrogenase YdfG